MANCGKILYDPADADLAPVYDPDDADLAPMFKDGLLATVVEVTAVDVAYIGGLSTEASEAAAIQTALASMLDAIANNTVDGNVNHAYLGTIGNAAGYNGRSRAKSKCYKVSLKGCFSATQVVWGKTSIIRFLAVPVLIGEASGYSHGTQATSTFEWTLMYGLTATEPEDGPDMLAACLSTLNLVGIEGAAIGIEFDPGDAAWIYNEATDEMEAYVCMLAYPTMTGYAPLPDPYVSLALAAAQLELNRP